MSPTPTEGVLRLRASETCTIFQGLKVQILAIIRNYRIQQKY